MPSPVQLPVQVGRRRALLQRVAQARRRRAARSATRGRSGGAARSWMSFRLLLPARGRRGGGGRRRRARGGGGGGSRGSRGGTERWLRRCLGPLPTRSRARRFPLWPSLLLDDRVGWGVAVAGGWAAPGGEQQLAARARAPRPARAAPARAPIAAAREVLASDAAGPGADQRPQRDPRGEHQRREDRAHSAGGQLGGLGGVR